MKFAIAFAAVYLVMLGALLTLGVVVGLLLRWMIPDIELGSAVLVGAISTLGSLHFFLCLIKTLPIPIDNYHPVLGDEFVPRSVVSRPANRKPRQKKKAWSARD